MCAYLSTQYPAQYRNIYLKLSVGRYINVLVVVRPGWLVWDLGKQVRPGAGNVTEEINEVRYKLVFGEISYIMRRMDIFT